MRKLGDLLGAGHLGLTTHSFRRSGASELARQGVSMPDILLYGRWLSERSAREYIRKGEVAIFRTRHALQLSDLRRIQSWAGLGATSWDWYDRFFQYGGIHVDLKKLTALKLTTIEGVLFGRPGGMVEEVGRA